MITEKPRIKSIDIFRGLTMALMVIVNNPGDWSNIYAPFKHAEWNGCTPTDLVFPFFVFAMGMAVPFSRTKPGGITIDFLKTITIRSLRIINLGLMLNFFTHINIGELEGLPLMLIRVAIAVFIGWLMLGKFKNNIKLFSALAVFGIFILLAYSGLDDYKNVRLPGVLQRLGVIYFLGALIYKAFNFKSQLILGSVILLAYWAVMALLNIPGIGAPNYEIGTNFSAYIDQLLLNGHMWIATDNKWDPEGVLSTVPAIVSFLFGVWCGKYMKEAKHSFGYFVATGLLLIIIGQIWNLSFPINKSFWSSSYVIYTSGLGILIMGILIAVFDNKKDNSFSKFFVMWGMNPMILFYGSGLIPRALNMIKLGDSENSAGILTYFYRTAIVPIFNEPKNASLTYALINVLFWTLILLWFKRKNLLFKV